MSDSIITRMGLSGGSGADLSGEFGARGGMDVDRVEEARCRRPFGAGFRGASANHGLRYAPPVAKRLRSFGAKCDGGAFLRSEM